MIKVVGVTIGDSKQIYYFNPKNLDLRRNVTVIVDTERGLQFGKVILPPFNINEEMLRSALKDVVRISTKKDYLHYKQNIKYEKEALDKCRELALKYQLSMSILDASFTFDRNQLLFRFISDNRVDFRELARELANIYKTRIELHQIGVRDKAKEVGGCGLCGRQLCCSRFNADFTSVSINMAKNQNLSLNPNKINGVCGRLLCCLRYEDDTYSEYRKQLPSIGTIVETDKGRGKVVSLDIIKGKYNVEVKDVGIIEMEQKI